MTDGSAWFDPVHGNEWEGPAELTIGHLGAHGRSPNSRRQDSPNQ